MEHALVNYDIPVVHSHRLEGLLEARWVNKKIIGFIEASEGSKQCLLELEHEPGRFAGEPGWTSAHILPSPERIEPNEPPLMISSRRRPTLFH